MAAKREGQIDQLISAVKEAVGNALDSMRGTLQTRPAKKVARAKTASRKKK